MLTKQLGCIFSHFCAGKNLSSRVPSKNPTLKSAGVRKQTETELSGRKLWMLKEEVRALLGALECECQRTHVCVGVSVFVCVCFHHLLWCYKSGWMKAGHHWLCMAGWLHIVMTQSKATKWPRAKEKFSGAAGKLEINYIFISLTLPCETKYQSNQC